MRSLYERCTYLPESVQNIVALPLLALACQRKCYVSISTRTYYPNIYMLLVAPSRAGKQVAIEDVHRRIIESETPDFLVGDTFTVEGLLQSLSERDPAVGIYVNDEITNIIGSRKRYMADVEEILIKLYNSPDRYVRQLASRVVTLSNVYFNLYSGTQPERFANVLSKYSFMSGFMPRITVLAYDKPKRRQVQSLIQNRDLLQLIKQEYRLLVALFSQIEHPVPIELTPNAQEMFWEFADKTEIMITQNESALEPYIANLPDTALKLSILSVIDKIPLVLSYLHYTRSNLSNLSNKSSKSNKSIVSDSIYKYYSESDTSVSMEYKPCCSKDDEIPGLSDVIDFFDTIDKFDKLDKLDKLGRLQVEDFVKLFKIHTCDMQWAINLVLQLFDSAHDLLLSWYGTYDQKEYLRVLAALERCPIYDFNNKQYVLRRDIVRHVGRTLTKILPYIQILQDNHILGQVEKIPTGKRGRAIVAYEVLSDDNKHSE